MISIKDQIIYGRRGTGKTHLLKALQEKLLADDQKYLPVYIDLRTFKPTLESDNDLYYALIIFQEIVVEVRKRPPESERILSDMYLYKSVLF